MRESARTVSILAHTITMLPMADRRIVCDRGDRRPAAGGDLAVRRSQAIARWALVIFSGLALASSTLLAQKQTVINVTEHRPLWPALGQIEQAFGSAVNYEDVPYEHADDLEVVTDPRVRAHIGSRPSRVPRKGTVTVAFDDATSEPAKVALLNNLLATYRQAGLPGDFRVELANGMLYVVGIRIKGIDGRLRDLSSPMSIRVDVPFGRRTVIETVALIADEVSKAGGVRVLGAQVPFAAEVVSFEARRETARDAIARVFLAAHPERQTSYCMIFDTLVSSYMLNLNALPPAVPSADGSVRVLPDQPSGTSKWLNPVER